MAYTEPPPSGLRRFEHIVSKQRDCREPLPAAGERGTFTDRLGELREVLTQRQAGCGAELGRCEGGHLVARGVVKPSHGSRFRSSEEGGCHRLKSICPFIVWSNLS